MMTSRKTCSFCDIFVTFLLFVRKCANKNADLHTKIDELCPFVPVSTNFPSKNRLQKKGRACCLTVRQYAGQKGHLTADSPGEGDSGGFLRTVRSSSHIDLIFAERRFLTVRMARTLITTVISSVSSFGSECRVSPSLSSLSAGSQMHSVIK